MITIYYVPAALPGTVGNSGDQNRASVLKEPSFIWWMGRYRQEHKEMRSFLALVKFQNRKKIGWMLKEVREGGVSMEMTFGSNLSDEEEVTGDKSILSTRNAHPKALGRA